MIEAVGVSKTYQAAKGRSVVALTAISLSVKDGEFVSIVGPSGCGKSTFLNLVAGLLPISSGTITLGGKRVTQPSIDVGIVFQNALLLDWLRLRHLVEGDDVAADLLLPGRGQHHRRAEFGAGNGGFNLVAHLGAAGHTMRLHDIDDAKLADLRSRGGVETDGMGKGFAALERVTTDLAAAIKEADVIVVCTGGHRQAAVAKSLAPVLADGQILLLVQGNTGGSLAFRRVLDEAGCRAKVELAEMDNYPYSSKKLGPAKMAPIVTKRWLQIASFPGNRIDAVFATLGPLFPTAVAAANVLHTGFTNANAMLLSRTASPTPPASSTAKPINFMPTASRQASRGF